MHNVAKVLLCSAAMGGIGFLCGELITPYPSQVVHKITQCSDLLGDAPLTITWAEFEYGYPACDDYKDSERVDTGEPLFVYQQDGLSHPDPQDTITLPSWTDFRVSAFADMSPKTLADRTDYILHGALICAGVGLAVGSIAIPIVFDS